ncbi:hypothetical protein CPB84DRAFT_1751688 [Gymnopilus junonius]|uniref:Uncharacterized protein n=1 Tax=Gymnopilus junonius TaxID=109634 RepID=A0A9P5NCW0_GYMJU|nr:hypothetical protein CPB84DRAFT_1751688 [Gymnopilus junonius]
MRNSFALLLSFVSLISCLYFHRTTDICLLTGFMVDSHGLESSSNSNLNVANTANYQESNRHTGSFGHTEHGSGRRFRDDDSHDRRPSQPMEYDSGRHSGFNPAIHHGDAHTPDEYHGHTWANRPIEHAFFHHDSSLNELHHSHFGPDDSGRHDMQRFGGHRGTMQSTGGDLHHFGGHESAEQRTGSHAFESKEGHPSRLGFHDASFRGERHPGAHGGVEQNGPSHPFTDIGHRGDRLPGSHATEQTVHPFKDIGHRGERRSGAQGTAEHPFKDVGSRGERRPGVRGTVDQSIRLFTNNGRHPGVQGTAEQKVRPFKEVGNRGERKPGAAAYNVHSSKDAGDHGDRRGAYRTTEHNARPSNDINHHNDMYLPVSHHHALHATNGNMRHIDAHIPSEHIPQHGHEAKSSMSQGHHTEFRHETDTHSIHGNSPTLHKLHSGLLKDHPLVRGQLAKGGLKEHSSFVDNTGHKAL